MQQQGLAHTALPSSLLQGVSMLPLGTVLVLQHHRRAQSMLLHPQTMTVRLWLAASWRHVCHMTAAHLWRQAKAARPVSSSTYVGMTVSCYVNQAVPVAGQGNRIPDERPPP